MKKILIFLVPIGISLLLLAACGQTNNPGGDLLANDKLKVVTSFTIIEDIAQEIGGDHFIIHNLVPTGTDPHEYEPLPKDIKETTDAHILFYNGLNLEGGKDGWFLR